MLKGLLKFNEPLAPYTSWRVGGVADVYYRPFDEADLCAFLKTRSIIEPITWLGLGSNVLVHDEGVRGVVIHTLGSLLNAKDSIVVDKDHLVRVTAGTTCAKLAKYCAKNGLAGGEFFAGIPGTVGGALAMNAGAWGSETWRFVEKVEVVNRLGERRERKKEDYHIHYRSVVCSDMTEEKTLQEWFLAGYFNFEKGDVKNTTQKIKNLLQERTQKQPIGVFSCGSVFKNPKNDHAGRLIEATGLKGFKVGDAEVSHKHANFILNLGKATAQDILSLIQHVQSSVFKEHGVQLEPEVRLIGF